jgi:hypothetical protein
MKKPGYLLVAKYLLVNVNGLLYRRIAELNSTIPIVSHHLAAGW